MNLIRNPDFESGELRAGRSEFLPGWSMKPYDSDEVVYSLDSSERASGERSLRIETGAERIRYAQAQPRGLYPAEGGARAKLTFSYKLIANEPGVELQARITQYDSRKKAMVSAASSMTRFKASDDWSRVSVEYELVDTDPDGGHVGVFFRLISSKATLWLDDVELTIAPGPGRFRADVPGITPPEVVAPSGIAESGFEPLFAEGGFVVRRSAADILIEAGDARMNVKRDDGAVVSELTGADLHYERGKGGLFRDLFWLPEEARWGIDAHGEYKLGEVSLDEGRLGIAFERELLAPGLEGMRLTKRYLVEPGLDRVAAMINIANESRETREFRYWSWHRFSLKSDDASYAFQGDPTLEGGAMPSHTFFRPRHSQWIKVGGRHYLGWDAGWSFKSQLYLDRVHLWNDPASPSVGMIGKVAKLGGKQRFRVRITYNRITERITAPAPLEEFALAHPYGARKRLAYRASIHNHSRYAPSYTHAPVPSDERLRYYRDFECDPPYRVVSITEHNRLTLPSNTDPLGAENPPWGVEGMLFIPGAELTMGNRYSLPPGDMFGEINCVGLPTGSDDPTDQKSFHHAKVPKSDPGLYLKNLVDAGAYVGLCHPNARLDAERVHRWPMSGYNYDELDIIFGNPEKGIGPLEQLPLGLEVGNQGYDFTDRSDYTNAEEKWDKLLARGFRLVGTASDDSHGESGCAGWIVAFMDELTYDEFMESLLSGNFYASQGPRITDIEVSGKVFRISTDEPSLIEFIGRGGEILHSSREALAAAYTVRGDEVYVRARVTRDCPEMKRKVGGGIGFRRSAWTNPVYLEPAP